MESGWLQVTEVARTLTLSEDERGSVVEVRRPDGSCPLRASSEGGGSEDPAWKRDTGQRGLQATTVAMTPTLSEGERGPTVEMRRPGGNRPLNALCVAERLDDDRHPPRCTKDLSLLCPSSFPQNLQLKSLG